MLRGGIVHIVVGYRKISHIREGAHDDQLDGAIIISVHPDVEVRDAVEHLEIRGVQISVKVRSAPVEHRDLVLGVGETREETGARRVRVHARGDDALGLGPDWSGQEAEGRQDLRRQTSAWAVVVLLGIPAAREPRKHSCRAAIAPEYCLPGASSFPKTSSRLVLSSPYVSPSLLACILRELHGGRIPCRPGERRNPLANPHPANEGGRKFLGLMATRPVTEAHEPAPSLFVRGGSTDGPYTALCVAAVNSAEYLLDLATVVSGSH